MALIPKFVLEARAAWLGRKILPFVPVGSKVLDFGCGDMLVSEFLFEQGVTEITGTDIFDFRGAAAKHFPFVQCSLRALPFRDREFDVVLVCFVLHHIRQADQKQVLQELARVAKKIVLVEDVYDTGLERIGVCVCDFIGNKLLSSFRIPTPFSFRKISNWVRMLNRDFGRVGSVEVFKSMLRAKHAVFSVDT